MEAGASGYMHIFSHHMDKLVGGVHRLDFYINDELVLSQYLTLLPSTDWDRLISQPDSGELLRFKPTDISPYICCYPQFKGVKGYTEYAVDFKADRLPYGTYLACANFSMTSDSLKAANARVWNDVNGDGLFAYCGFQEIYDGSRVAICSVWDTHVTDRQGRTSTIRAEVVHAADPIKAGSFDGEGVGAQCLVRYNWEPCNTYRLLLQLRKSEETGTQHLSMWVLDMDSMSWTLLIEYDLKVPDAYMHDTCAFLENYLPEYAGDVRTMELSNFRALSLDGRWVGTREAVFCLGYDHPGSYTYGGSGNTFYAITTGLPNRCARPKDWLTVTVGWCEPGSPY